MECYFEPLSGWLLISIGIILIGLELLVANFFIIFVGAGMILVGFAGLFFFTGGLGVQVLGVVLISVILSTFFREKLSSALKDDEELGAKNSDSKN